jgi:glucosyl-3-phosphoglycerate synthase
MRYFEVSKATRTYGVSEYTSLPWETTGEPSQIKQFDAAGLDDALVLSAKAGHRVSVIIPAKNEASTLGAVIAAVLTHGPNGSGLVDEILVVDDGSDDGTADVAAHAGADVLTLAGGGKGGAMAAGVGASTGDLLVFLDGDVENTAPHFLPRLIGPLLFDADVMLVKAYYDRPFEGEAAGGGRVTELAARPALRLLFPELVQVRQPLAGETATRREVLDKVGLEKGYRVEMALLIDVGTSWGAASIAEVDLGIRIHRNRPLSELGPMATEVLAVALERSEIRQGVSAARLCR